MGLFDFLKKNKQDSENVEINSSIQAETEKTDEISDAIETSDTLKKAEQISSSDVIPNEQTNSPPVTKDVEEVADNYVDDVSDDQASSQEYSDASDEHKVLNTEIEPEKKQGFFDRLKNGLKKTKESVFGQINDIFKSFVKVDEDMLEELEEVLIASDVGISITQEIIEQLRDVIKTKHISEPSLAKDELISILQNTIGQDDPLEIKTSPTVILVIGVNGVGKTTSIAKLANMLKSQGKSVVLAAADTFRAAAIDQLEIWANRVNVPIVKHTEGADPAAVVFDACSYVKSHKADVLIVDTAGRLHIKKNLMDELAKISRVIDRELAGAHKETLLILDAVTGQNAINQAKEFMNTSQITGIILTKLDGTAKGGIIISVKKELGIPVKFIGVGEQMDDLQEFNRQNFVKALFED